MCLNFGVQVTVNQTSSNFYYTYETNGSQWTLSSFLESSKYAKTMETSVGVDPVLDETGSGASTLADLGRGLVGYWPLDEGTGATAYDWSGSGDNGTLNASTTWGVGQVDGTAASFPSSSSANITTSPNNQVNINDNLTISFWLQGASTTGAYAAIVANDPTFTTGYMVARAATTTNVYIRLDTSAGTNQNGGVIGNAFNGNWNQVVWTISSGTVKGYLNGSLASNGSFLPGTGLATSSDYFLMGRNSGANFIGLLEDVRVYNRVLSAAEIQEMYNAER